MQYAKASCCFGQQPLHPQSPIISQSSLKTPHPNNPHPHPHPLIHTQNITKHDYVTKPVSLGKRWSTVKLPNPPGSHPSVREGRRGLGAVVPLVCLRVVHLHCVEELVAIESTHGVDGFTQHGNTRVAAGRCHAAQHPPLIAHGVVHLHTAERVGAIETANDKQFAWTGRDVRINMMTHPNSTSLMHLFWQVAEVSFAFNMLLNHATVHLWS